MNSEMNEEVVAKLIASTIIVGLLIFIAFIFYGMIEEDLERRELAKSNPDVTFLGDRRQEIRFASFVPPEDRAQYLNRNQLKVLSISNSVQEIVYLVESTNRQ